MPDIKQQIYFPINKYLENHQSARPPESSTTPSNSLFPQSQDNSARSKLSNTDSFPITRYLEDNGDSLLPQHLATRSRLPDPATGSFHRPTAGTSMLLSGNDSLAALTTASSVSSGPSVSSSLGERYLGSSRTLGHDHEGALIVAPLRHQVAFECPFNFLYCHCTFISFSEWLNHSLTHFRSVTPSPMNMCCFCDVTFNRLDGMRSWRAKMEHTAIHYQLGHKLAHARPDFELHKYLWQKRLIGADEYKELMVGNRESGASMATPGNHSNIAHTATHWPRRERRRLALR